MRGLRIGNTLERNDPFAGDIDEIKVWRLDPYERQRQFMSRPMDEATAECWERYLLRMRMALRENPDCGSFVSNLEAAFNRVLRAVVSKSAGSEAKLFELRRRYNELWHKGTISGPEMLALMQEVDALLRDAGVALDSDPAINEIAQSPCLKRLLDAVGPLDCDPTYSAFVQSVGNAVALPQRKRSTVS
jgi:hypothetical protein